MSLWTLIVVGLGAQCAVSTCAAYLFLDEIKELRAKLASLKRADADGA